MARAAHLGPVQLFTIAFGTIAGIAWVFLTGPWLAAAGSIGTVLALALGALAMLPIVAVYAALARRIPGSGGEILYAGTALGGGAAFMAGWLLAACYITLVAFILITVAWLVDVCLESVGRQFGIGVPYAHEAGIAVSATALVVVVMANFRGVRSAARLQDVIIALKLIAVTGLAVLAFAFGSTTHLSPAFGESPLASVRGIVSVLVTAPFLYAGFNTAVQAVAEVDGRRLHLVRRAFFAAIACAALFYGMIVLSVAVSMPRGQLLSEELPALGGFAAALRSPLAAAVVAVVALLALASSWNAVTLAGCRVLVELSRRGHLPAWVHTTNAPERTPVGALAIVVICAVALSALGRDAVGLTVGTVSFFMALVFTLACVSLWRLPADQDAPRERQVAALGALIAAGLVALALVVMLSEDGASIQLLLVLGWLVIGHVLQRRRYAQALE